MTNKKIRQHYQIAIDGPGGAGKSTVAKLVAKKLNFLFINTGAMYRAYAYAIGNGNYKNETDVEDILKKNNVTLKKDLVFLNNKNITQKIYTPKISLIASKIATFLNVRKKCVFDQRNISNNTSCVMEGRDTTSVVLPNATLKVFLTASIDVRANRRWLQSNKKQDLNEIKQDLIKRDYQDTNRVIDPLIIVNDAVVLNTDNLKQEEVVNKIIALFKIKKSFKK